MAKIINILGIETSCDETAVAIVNSNKQILSHIVLSQIQEHAPYKGVVPEIAARSHMQNLDKITKQCLKDANLNNFNELDAIAVTAGPGLIGGVIVGVMMAKAIASVTNLPIIAVNHLEGHALTPRISSDVEFPFMLLLLSGGHCQILSVSGVGKYKLLGQTLDDALGEAYDKVAKMLGLAYPGGPIVEKLALDGDRHRFNFPKPLHGRDGCDFSFSGLKTAVKRQVDDIDDVTDKDIADICASFEYCVGEILTNRLKNAFNEIKKILPDCKTLVLAGGVAANKYIRKILEEIADKNQFALMAPPLDLCTDNGAMIAWAGMERFRLNLTDNLDFNPKARWPLEDLS